MDLADSLAIGARLYAAIENPKQAIAAAEGASIGMRMNLAVTLVLPGGHTLRAVIPCDPL